MLKPAILYIDQIKELMYNKVWFNPHYQYFNQVYDWVDKVDEDTKSAHQFVSIDKQGNICGVIYYYVDRYRRTAQGVNALSFDVNPYVFGKDVMQAIDDVFNKYKFNKLNFGVVVGNPIEPTYDKLCKKAGGKIAGYYEEDTILYDGRLADIKVYEILRKNYTRLKGE